LNKSNYWNITCLVFVPAPELHLKKIIAQGKSTLEVLRNYQQSLTKAGFEILFTCAQAQCGDSLNVELVKQ